MKYQKDSLGDRMKDTEHRFKHRLSRKTWTIIRLDGKAFHSFTKGFKRPFDDVLVNAMNETCKYLCENIQGVKVGYIQSDEITLILTDFESNETQLWFDGNIQKITSISASLATSKFNQIMMLDKISNFAKIETALTLYEYLDKSKLAQFDSRVFQVHTQTEARNNILWRQQDATRNSIQAVAQSLYSHKELEGKHTDDLQEMIFQKGINWNDYDDGLKRGRWCYKKQVNFISDNNNNNNNNNNNQYTRNKWIGEGSPILSSEQGIVSFNNITDIAYNLITQ